MEAEVLEANPPSNYTLGVSSSAGHACVATTRLMRMAVTFFPGPINLTLTLTLTLTLALTLT